MLRLTALVASIVLCGYASIASAQPTFSAPVDLSTPGIDSKSLTLAMSSDGTRATAIWLEKDAQKNVRILTSSATISGGTATWGATTVLSAAGTEVRSATVRLSSDGTKAVALWNGVNSSTAPVVESRAATISGNTASWGTVVKLNTVSVSAIVSVTSLALSSDGTRAYAVWQRNVNSTCRIAVGSLGSMSGNSISWGTTIQISEPKSCVRDTGLGLSSSGSTVAAVWSTQAASGTRVVRARAGTISGSTTSWGAISDLSAPGFSAESPSVALSSDGTKAAAVWIRKQVTASGRATTPHLVRTRSATLVGNVATWGATTVLSPATGLAFQPQVAISADGSQLTAAWLRVESTNFLLQSASASVVGNVASWGSLTNVSGIGNQIPNYGVALTTDGSKAFATWNRSVNSTPVLQGAVGVMSGSNQLWTSVFDIFTNANSVAGSNPAISSDGAAGLTGWINPAPDNKEVARVSVAEFTHPTPTPTPVATNTPTATPTPAPTTTPVGAVSTAVPVPIHFSNDHYVVLRVKDYPTNFRRDYYGFLLRASDNTIVKMGKFKIRGHTGRLEFHDVPPGEYRTFTLVKRSRAPKLLSSRQRTIVVK